MGYPPESGACRCGPRRALEPGRGVRALRVNRRRIPVLAALDRSLWLAGTESDADPRLPGVTAATTGLDVLSLRLGHRRLGVGHQVDLVRTIRTGRRCDGRQ